MRDIEFVSQTMQLGGTVFSATIVMFFIVLAFRKDSIIVPVLFKWAIACLGASMLVPSFTLLLTFVGVSASRGGETKEMLMLFGAAASPLLFFSSIVLAMFALLPWSRSDSDSPRPSMMQRTLPDKIGPGSDQSSEPHPLD